MNGFAAHEPMPSAPYSRLLPDWRDRLRTLMKEKRYNARSLSLAAELGQTTVSEWLNPKKLKEPSLASAVKVAFVLGVKLDAFFESNETPEKDVVTEVEAVSIGYADLVGLVEAGAWREPSMYAVEDNATVPLVPHPDFLGFKQYAWRVVGPSMNKLVEPGSYVIGVSFFDIRRRRSLQSNDVVICERRDGEKREYTLKRAVKVDGRFRLDPESTDERYQQSVWAATDANGEHEEVIATHLIIGSFKILA